MWIMIFVILSHFPAAQYVGCRDGHHTQETIFANVIIKHLEEDVPSQRGVVNSQLSLPVPARILRERNIIGAILMGNKLCLIVVDSL